MDRGLLDADLHPALLPAGEVRLTTPLVERDLSAVPSAPRRGQNAFFACHLGASEGRKTPASRFDRRAWAPYEHGQSRKPEEIVMKVRNSLKSLRGRHRDNRLVRRKGRVYVINKTQRRFKARQG